MLELSHYGPTPIRDASHLKMFFRPDRIDQEQTVLPDNSEYNESQKDKISVKVTGYSI